jgi:hypothetical protein
MRTEKEQFDSKQKDELEKGSKTTEAAVVKLEEKKKVNEAKIVEIDKKIAAEMDKFDAEEKKYSGGNEEVKMKNEDEDRKYKVELKRNIRLSSMSSTRSCRTLTSRNLKKEKILKNMTELSKNI